MKAMTSGHIMAIHVEPGALVAPNQLLMELQNPLIQTAARTAQDTLTHTQSQWTWLQTHPDGLIDTHPHLELQARQDQTVLQLHRTIEHLRQLSDDLDAARRHKEETERLYLLNAGTRHDLDKAIQAQRLLERQLRLTVEEQQQIQRTLTEIEQGLQQLDGAQQYQRLASLSTANQLLADALHASEQAQQHLTDLQIKAPTEAHVAWITPHQGREIARGEPLITLYNDQNPVVELILEQDTPQRFWIGQPVNIRPEGLARQIYDAHVMALTESVHGSLVRTARIEFDHPPHPPLPIGTRVYVKPRLTQG